jgi:predicted nuclease with TOPRIM domain|tara:strand:- start:1612 stop:1809 length:198 start_codon:yes stop_codon:yes gene_type:complete
MNWQDYESLGHLELKGKLVEHISSRTKIIKEMEQSSEYEYCEIQGRIKELEDLITFIDNIKKTNL